MLLRQKDLAILLHLGIVSSLVPSGIVTCGDGRLDLKSVQQLLDVAGLGRPSDLDLLLFCYRHPHVLLSLEQLAAHTGYDFQQVARSLDFLVGAGVLRRSMTETDSREMYLVWTGTAGEWLDSVLQLGLTRDGRAVLTCLLRQRESEAGTAGSTDVGVGSS